MSSLPYSYRIYLGFLQMDNLTFWSLESCTIWSRVGDSAPHNTVIYFLMVQVKNGGHIFLELSLSIQKVWQDTGTPVSAEIYGDAEKEILGITFPPQHMFCSATIHFRIQEFFIPFYNENNLIPILKILQKGKRPL